MTTYTPAQQSLIEKHRDWNVDHGWWENTYSDFIEVAVAFGFDIDSSDISFSGFWSQGDGACFNTPKVNCYDLIMAGIKVEGDKPFGDKPTGYAKAFADLYGMLHDVFMPQMLVVPEVRQYAEAIQFNVRSNDNHYSHSHTMDIDLEVEGDIYCSQEDLEPHQFAAVEALEKKLLDDSVNKSMLPFTRRIRDGLRACADTLYKTLEQEHEYLTTDDAVWEALVANEIEVEDEEECDVTG